MLRGKHEIFKAVILSLTLLTIISTTVLADTVIDQVPFDCRINGESYILGGDLTASGTAITISASNVKINGNGHTLTYANSSAGSGISLRGNYRNTEIHNMKIVEGSGGGSAFNNNNYSPDGLDLQDLQIYMNTVAAIAIKIVNYSNDINVLINNNVIVLKPNRGSSGDALGLDSSGGKATGTIDSNTITIGGTLSSSRPASVNLSNVDGNLIISNNVITVEGPDDNNAIIFWDSSGHNISSNDITMNCSHCRGILIDGGSDNNQISGNKVK